MKKDKLLEIKEFVEGIRLNYGCHDCVIYGQAKDIKPPCWVEFLDSIINKIEQLQND